MNDDDDSKEENQISLTLSMKPEFFQFPPEESPRVLLHLTTPMDPSNDTLEQSVTILTIDVSGSMKFVLPKLKRTLAVLIDMAQILNKESCKIKFGLIAFNHDIELLIEPQALTVAFAQSLHASIDNLRAQGGTDLGKAVLGAFGLLNDLERAQTIILFSDGKNRCGEHSSAMNISAAAEKCPTWSPFIALHAVAIGTEVDMPTLVDLSSRSSGGTLIEVKHDERNLSAPVGMLVGLAIGIYARNAKLQVFEGTTHTVKNLGSLPCNLSLKIPLELSQHAKHATVTFEAKIGKFTELRSIEINVGRSESLEGEGRDFDVMAEFAAQDVAKSIEGPTRLQSDQIHELIAKIEAVPGFKKHSRLHELRMRLYELEEAKDNAFLTLQRSITNDFVRRRPVMYQGAGNLFSSSVPPLARQMSNCQATEAVPQSLFHAELFDLGLEIPPAISRS